MIRRLNTLFFGDQEIQMHHLVFDIKRFAVHDGSGIRTTVFLKGCSLHCPWCQNPEGLDARRSLLYDQSSCIHCYKCVEKCPEQAIETFDKQIKDSISINRDKCNLCGDCVQACPSGALKFDSKPMTPEMVLEEVLKDSIFYKQGNGGVTFSGGDPFFNPVFLKKCVELCKKAKLNVALETALVCNWNTISQFIGIVDLFIVDIKIVDENVHDKIVGGNGLLIKENIRKLNEQKANILLRTPLIPGFTDSTNNLKQIGAFYKELVLENNNIDFELLNFNPYAKSKYKRLGLPFNPVLDKKKYQDDEMEEFYTIVRKG